MPLDNPDFFKPHHSLESMAEDIAMIKRAVLGEKPTGTPGLVHDMQSMKLWRETLNLRIATVTGIFLGAAFVVKYLLTGSF
jgi:hypothetical protein